MRGKLFKRAMHALSAVVLVVGQIVLPPALGGQTQKAGAAGEQPVWCQLIQNGREWTAQIGGDNKNRWPLNQIPTGAGGGIFIGANGQVYAPNSSDPVLKGELEAQLAVYCATQYTVTAPLQVPVCGSNTDTITAGAHMTISADSGWSNNSRTVTFTATEPYVFFVNNRYVTSVTVTYTDANEPCPLTQIANPVVTPVVTCGPNNDTYTISQGHYTVAESAWVNGSKTLTFTADAGYTFAGGLTYTVNLTDDNTPCPAGQPTVSTQVACGANNDTVTVSTGNYTLTNDTGWVNNSRTFTFTANAGYVFANGLTTTTVTITDANTPCSIDNPVIETAVICSANNDTYTFSGSNFTLTGDSGWSNGSRTLVFTANPGYIFAGGATYSITLTDNDTACIVPVPATPGVNDPCGLDNAYWMVPNDTSTIDWYFAEDGSLHAKTIGNNTFPDGTTDKPYGFPQDSGTLCRAATPTVTATPVCGAANNDAVSVTGGSNYSYTVARSGSSITVTVTANADYEFADGVTHYDVTFTDALAPCSTNLPATLPSSDPCDDFGHINAPRWDITPEDTDMYTYTHNEDGSYTVTAEPGYILNIEGVGLRLSYTYTLPFNDPDNVCYETVPVPAVPSIDYVCGDTSTASWVMPLATEAYSWTLVDGALTVHANEGYVLQDGDELVTEKSFGTAEQNVTYRPCKAFYSTGYTYNDACGVLNDSLTLPENTEHVTYSYEKVNGYFVVTIKAATGYYLDQASDGSYIYTGTYRVKMGDYNPTLVCNVGMGSVKPAAAPAAVVQELPRTGAGDNSFLTLFGMAVSLATYGSVLALQRRRA